MEGHLKNGSCYPFNKWFLICLSRGEALLLSARLLASLFSVLLYLNAWTGTKPEHDW